MSDRSARVAALSPEKRALLVRRLIPRLDGTSSLTPLPRRPGVNVFRASFAQERLWFVERVASTGAAYNVAGAFEARGRLDLGVLRASLAALHERHETLRTTFVAMDGRPMQVVSPVAPVAMVVTDLRPAGAAAKSDAGALRAAIRREVEQTFDVSRGPLLRLRVLVLGADRHVVVLTMHHLIADAWSVGILGRELSALYRAAVVGERAALVDPVLQYADYAEWQRRESGTRRAVAAAYWRRQLADAPYPAVAAGDRLAFRGAAVTEDLAPDLVHGLGVLARRLRVTTFAVALAVWKLVAARAYGLDDVTVLSPVADRGRSEVAGVVGFFVNLIALRTRLGDDPRVADLVRRVGAVVREGIRHHTLPFEVVLGELGIDRTLARPPLSPVAFAVERPVDQAVEFPDVELTVLPLEIRTTRTDLALIVEERVTVDAWRVRLEYDRSLYEADEATALVKEFVRCARAFVDDPARRISTLRARDALPRPAVADETTVWGRFLGQAERTPGAVAVRAAGCVVTYEVLRDRALALAARLVGAGVGTDDVVAFVGARGAGWLRAMLGIWGAGAVYLPLDPRWPVARIREVLERSGARVVLCDDAASAAVVDPSERRVLCLDAGPRGISVRSLARVAGPRATDVAYVIYTSGSTGTPKGALIEHAGLANHLDAKISLLGLAAADRVAQTAPTSFDVSLWQGLAPLLVGGEVIVVDDDTVSDPVRLPATVGRLAVTVLELVPSVLQLVLDAAGPTEEGALGVLRWLLATGEALPPALCRRWLAGHPTIPLVNAYGPTECADDVTHYVVRTPPPPDAVRVPIGIPIAGMDVQVLDAELSPVAPGKAGELCVSGVGVARGYLGDPIRTAAAFVALRGRAGRATMRVYRTGDRGRRLPDGTFEWLGRLDAQVKIAGVRVEPEEVEAVLATHPAVRRAAVVAVPVDAPIRLAAWVETDESLAEVCGARLRAWVADRLPAAMVPAVITVRRRLPSTSHGKVDRHALAAESPELPASEDRSADAASLVPPTTATERLLAALWTEVLGVEVRAVTDGFFALGGDSLAALRLVAAARRHGLVLTPRRVFETPTLGALAAVAVSAPPAAEQGLVVGEVEPTPIQRMLLAADLPRLDHYNMTMLLAVESRIVPGWLAVAVEHLLRHHDALRLRVRREGGRPRVRIVGVEGPVPHEHVDLTTSDDVAAAVAIEATAAEAQASLDLADGPIVRVVSFDLGPHRPSRLLLVVHHLACDAASWPILLEDLAAVYAQVEAGASIALPAKTTSYRAWAEWLAGRAHSDALRDERRFWAEQCARPGARLPRVRAVACPAVADVAVHTFVLDGATTARLVAALARRGATMEAALVSALATAVAAVGGGDGCVQLYLEHHGRDVDAADVDVSRTVGWFTAVFPLSVRVVDGARANDTLSAVDGLLRAVPAGGIGWGLSAFAGEGCDSAALDPTARPEISCNYLGRIDPPRGLAWRRAPETPGAEVGAGGTRPTMLDVVAHRAAERLHVAWHYDSVAYEGALIRDLAARAFGTLCGLADAVDVEGEPGRAPGRSS